MWKAKTKDGREVALRFLRTDDRDGLFRMFSSMSDEALKWSGAPYTLDIVQRWISNIRYLIAIVAEYHNRIVGYAAVFKSPYPRKKGIGDYAIYPHQDFHNVGLGTAMTKRILQLAKKEKMHRIESGVVEENKIALHLYGKFGFQIEGVSKDGFYGHDGKYHRMVHMGLMLELP